MCISFTFTLTEVSWVPTLAVIVASPSFNAVTLPLLSTLATSSLFEVQVIFLSSSVVLSGLIFALRFLVWFLPFQILGHHL